MLLSRHNESSHIPKSHVEEVIEICHGILTLVDNTWNT
jgi:hypothetical protein